MGRFVLIVLDSVGVGELPDAWKYQDQGSDTLGNVAEAVGASGCRIWSVLGWAIFIQFWAFHRKQIPSRPGEEWLNGLTARTQPRGIGK